MWHICHESIHKQYAKHAYNISQVSKIFNLINFEYKLLF
jgi:hypothetical protein